MIASNDAEELCGILSGLTQGKSMTQSEKVLRVAYRYYLKNSKALTHGTWDNRSAKVCSRAIFAKIVAGLVNEGYVLWSKSRCGSTVHYFLTEEGMNKGYKLHNNMLREREE